VIGESESPRALARLERGERFDAMLCDVMMPGLDGMQLYSATLALSREQAGRFVFVTGGVSNPDVHAFLEDTGRACVEKPFDLHALRATVRKLVGAR
jgi:CheY-like chemotaxis protein